MAKKILEILLVEDNQKLNSALRKGLDKTGEVKVIESFKSGEETVEFCKNSTPDAILMDVGLEKKMNGIETIIEIRKYIPRLPVVIYSIQDQDSYFRDFKNSGILSHYAYVKKSNFLLPEMIIPLIKDAYSGKSFIDPEIESRVLEVSHTDENSPLELLEPVEKKVALMLARGFSNEQMAKVLGYKDKRSISRINGLIYTIWELREDGMDEAVARTRASIMVRENKMLNWEDDGRCFYKDTKGEWVEWNI
ncbi:MAG: response regulator transcription factor [Leptospiraceae bacterium]|nr:response regulator transcription factor [Leptospiraceae bacterium]